MVILTIDTLRADHLSSYGYRRPTTPNIDRLLAAGARFSEARTVEPLTTPALGAMLTSLYPHEHGATRNGMRLRPGLPSLARTLGERGYRTAAFVGNWTLKDHLSGFGEHFERYEEVFTRKRWFGLFKDETTAEDLTDAALAWLSGIRKQRGPFLLWVHYVDPHAPYRLHEEVAGQLGLDSGAAAGSPRRTATTARSPLPTATWGGCWRRSTPTRSCAPTPCSSSPATTARASASTATGGMGGTSTSRRSTSRWGSPGPGTSAPAPRSTRRR